MGYIKYYPPELQGRWGRPYQERMGIWERIISEGLGIPENEAAERLADLGCHNEPENYKMAARLLADASDFYVSGRPLEQGPRGRRPILVTGKNITELCGAPTENAALNGEKRLRKHFGSTEQLVTDLGFTASNPEEFTDIRFSTRDILRGLYLPIEIDAQAARALGVILAQYSFVFNQGSYSIFHFQHEELGFYEHSGIPAIEDAFNIRTKPLENKNSRGYSHYLIICSKALASYLIDYIGLARTDDVALHSGVPEKIKGMAPVKQLEFLMYFLPSATYFDKTERISSVYTGSRQFAEDLTGMISGIGVTGLRPRQDRRTGNYRVHMPPDATRRLFEEGFFDLNRNLKDRIKRAL
ncbi:MAG: hypothetical protein HY051_03005 [Candidatus Aenigmarchaeota archaeon]|nr:hypothetical protein [Candidatus Aenigmarchaeota archaeon]